MQAVFLLVLAMLASACAGDREKSPAELVLRLSTHMGISPLLPGRSSTISAHLGGLVYLPATQFFQIASVSPTQIVLERRADASHTLPELASAFRCTGSASVHIEGHRLAIDSTDGDLIEDIAAGLGVFELGPYRVDSYAPTRLVLARKRPGDGPARIEVSSFGSEEEEWRRLLAHDVDLVPFVDPESRRWLAEVSSIKLVPVSEPSRLFLYFDTQQVPLEHRRALAAAIHRSALGRAVTGSSDTSEDVQISGPSQNPEIPSSYHIGVHDANTLSQRTALIVQQHLARARINVAVDVLDLPTLARESARGQLAMVIHHGGYSAALLRRVRGDVPYSIAKYENEDFYAAADRGDESAVRALLRRDVPMTPLVIEKEVVAVDARYCGVHPTTLDELAWLADVHPCGSGELE